MLLQFALLQARTCWRMVVAAVTVASVVEAAFTAAALVAVALAAMASTEVPFAAARHSPD